MGRIRPSLIAMALLLAMLSMSLQGSGFSLALAETTVPSPEFWRLGFTVKETPAYTSTIGRGASVAAAFRSDLGTSHVFYVFPAVSSQRVAQAASFYILSRSGSYGGSATMSLEVFDRAGNLKHTVSAESIDLETAAAGAWVPISLSSTGTDRAVAPGEFMAFHLALSSGPGGNFDVRPVFEVAVGPDQVYLLYLPVLLRNY